jgi:hypothetical protein
MHYIDDLIEFYNEYEEYIDEDDDCLDFLWRGYIESPILFCSIG